MINNSNGSEGVLGGTDPMGGAQRNMGASPNTQNQSASSTPTSSQTSAGTSAQAFFAASPPTNNPVFVSANTEPLKPTAPKVTVESFNASAQKKSQASKNAVAQKGKSGRWVAAGVVAVLIIGGVVLWNRNSAVSPSDTGKEVAQVATEDVPQSKPADAAAIANPVAASSPAAAAIANPTVQSYGGPFVLSTPSISPSPSYTSRSNIVYPNAFSQNIGSQLEALKTQLERLRDTYQIQAAAMSETNGALETLKQKLLEVKAGAALQDSMTVVNIQDQMETVRMASNFVNFDNAQTMGILLDMHQKLNDLGALIAAKR